MDVDNECIKFMYNASYGGFSFSKKAMAMYHEATGNHSIVSRKDEVMINIVEQLKNKANGPHAKIKIVNVPIKFENCIVCDEHDGYETVSVDYSLYKLTKRQTKREAPLFTTHRDERYHKRRRYFSTNVKTFRIQA